MYPCVLQARSGLRFAKNNLHTPTVLKRIYCGRILFAKTLPVSHRDKGGAYKVIKAFAALIFSLLKCNKMVSTIRLSRLMKLSWDIQKRKHKTRSKALQSAWAIVNNEDLTVSYLTRKLNRDRPISNSIQNQFALFG